ATATFFHQDDHPGKTRLGTCGTQSIRSLLAASHAAEVVLEVAVGIDRNDRLAVDLQIARIFEEVFNPIGDDVVCPVVWISLASALIGKHDGKFFELTVSGIEESIAQALFQDAILDGIIDCIVGPIPAIHLKADAVLDLPLDLPVGDLWVAIVIPAKIWRPPPGVGFDITPPGISVTLLPQRTTLHS